LITKALPTNGLGWLLAALLFAAPGAVFAQSAAATATVTGVAVDESGGVVPGATVTATDTQAGLTRTAVTGADGRFSLTVPPGTYVVRAELDGFIPSQSNPTRLAAGQTASLTLTFKIQPYGETVTVTGSRSPESIRATPVAITVVRSDTIDTSAATQFADLLRQVPGLNAIELSPRDVQISTRTATGRAARTTLALLDGRSVYQDYFGMVLWDLMPVNFNELKQVEVLRGPGSALWGANAMTGVINMITKSPREMLGTEAYAGVGERGTREAGAVHAGADGRLSYKVSGSYFTQDPWTRPTALPDGTPLPPFAAKGTTQYKGDVRLDFDRTDTIKWRFDAGTATSGGVMLVASGPFDVQPMRQSYASGEYLNGTTSIAVSVNAHKAHYNGLLAPQTVDVSSQSYRIDARDSRTVGGKHLLVYGGSAAHSHFDLTFAPNAHRREEAGAFLSDDIFITEQVRLSGGVRLDYYNTFGASLSPRVGLLVDVAPGQTMRATFNRAYVAPSITENFMNFPSSVEVPLPTGNYTLPFLALGDEKLARETIDAGELGYTGVIGGRATISLSAYKNRTQGLINLLVEQLYSPTDPPAGWPLPPAALAAIPLPKLFRWTSVGQLDESGLEAGIDLALARGVSASANYSLQTTPDLSGPNGSAVPFEVNKPPRHRVNLGLQWHRRQFLGSLTANYTDRAFWADVLSYKGWTESFWLVNGTIGVTSPDSRFTWLITGTNLADNAVQQHIFGDIIRRRVLTELRVKF
jgi:outer membrane receptor protein involved in Fe transport